MPYMCLGCQFFFFPFSFLPIWIWVCFLPGIFTTTTNAFISHLCLPFSPCLLLCPCHLLFLVHCLIIKYYNTLFVSIP
uniref:Uncharacterized protein n=1 Tax=Arundo donax TaxID=35708 RepID=A0A0A9APK4_ARUDO